MARFPSCLLAFLATLLGAAEADRADLPLEIAGWRFVHPGLPKPLTGGDNYELSFVSQVPEAGTWIVTVEFKRAPGKAQTPAALTLIEDEAVLQASLVVRHGRTENIAAGEQKLAQGRMKFVIEKDTGTKLLLALPIERSDEGKPLQPLSNVLELK
jgi:hypothetical protein